MSLVARISDQLKDANARIEELDRSLAARPNDLALRYMLGSIEKHRRELESDFEQTTAAIGVDVCNYRLFGEGAEVAVGLFRALAEFQDFLTITFAAVKTGPRQTRRVGNEFTVATALGFSHSYAGSSGFVFTLPNERLLFDESALDAAFVSIFEMAKLRNVDGIRAYAAKYGRAVIRQLHDWSAIHADNDLGADIDWRRGEDIRSNVFVQPQELDQLRTLIEQTSDSEVETLVLRGRLSGVDATTGRFHFEPDDRPEIRGIISVSIDDEHSVPIPSRHRATIEVTRTYYFATEHEQTEYNLVDLRPLSTGL